MEANDRSWQVRAAGFPHTNKKGQSQIISDLNSLGSVGKVRRNSWEVVDANSGVDIIGLECKIHGAEWLDKHPNAKEFLSSKGISAEQAIESHEKWQAELYTSLGRNERGQTPAMVEKLKRR